MIFRVSFGTVAVFAILSMPYHQLIKTDNQGDVDTTFVELEKVLHNGNGEKQLRNRRAIYGAASFKFANVVRWLSVYKGQALQFLLHRAIKVSASKKRVIFKKQGNFQQAMQDFDGFDPYDIKSFQLGEERYGVSAKIIGYTDVHGIESASPELDIVVRSWSTSLPHSPTLEIFPPDTRQARSFRLKMRYVEN